MSVQTQLLSMCAQMGLPLSGVPNPEPVAALLVGAPGTSKTDILKGIAQAIEKRLGMLFPIETMACPQMAPENIAGVPVPDRERKVTDLYVLSLGKKLIEAGQGILFLDEFSSASETVAAANLTLIQSGMLGDTKLPSGVARVIAMNDPERATAGRPLMAPESNRMCWIPWELQANDWIDYMKGGPGAAKEVVMLPQNWEVEFYFMAASLVTSFIRSAPNRLLNEPEAHKAGCAWPSPRSWRNATRLLAACYALGHKVNSNLVAAAIQGCVGDAAANEFLVYAAKLDLPDPEEVLAKGDKFKFPERDDKVLCILENVAAIACADHPNKAERWEAACKLVEHAAKKKSDVVITVIEFLMKRKPTGAKIPNIAAVYIKTVRELGIQDG